MKDLSLMEALQWILGLAMEKIRSAGIVTEDVALAPVDSIMDIAIDMLHAGQGVFRNNNVITSI